MRMETPFQPEEVNYDASRIDALEAHFQRMMDRNELQGVAYCMSRDQKKFALGSLGVLEYKEDCKEQLPVNAIFNIASITKLFTAVAVMKLVEDGYIRLNQSVSTVLEEFKIPIFEDITFAHLLTHTSGLQADPNCFENPYFLGPWELIDKGFEKGDKEWLKNALRSGLRRTPGTEWAYCTFGFSVLGEAISRIVGENVHTFIENELLKPCEMTESGFATSLKKDIVYRLATANKDNQKLKDNLATLGIAYEGENELWNLVPDTGGGLYSTVEDLSKFGNMLLAEGYYNGKRVIGKMAIEKMCTRHTDSSIKEYCWGAGGVERAYALGPDIRNNLANTYSKETFFHEGAGSCCLMIDPREKMVASWYVPYRNNAWYAEGLYNASSVMWSGLR